MQKTVSSSFLDSKCSYLFTISVLRKGHSSFKLTTALTIADKGFALPHRCRKHIEHYAVAEWPAAQLRSSANDLAKFLCALTVHKPKHMDINGKMGLDTEVEGLDYNFLTNKEMGDIFPQGIISSKTVYDSISFLLFCFSVSFSLFSE